MVSSLTAGWQRERSTNFTACVTGVAVEEDLVGDAWTRTMMQLNAAAAGHPDPFAANELVDLAIMERIRARVDESVQDPAPRRSQALLPIQLQAPDLQRRFPPRVQPPNVRLIDTGGHGVERVTPDGVVVDGVLHELDVLIFATGFDVGTPTPTRAASI